MHTALDRELQAWRARPEDAEAAAAKISSVAAAQGAGLFSGVQGLCRGCLLSVSNTCTARVLVHGSCMFARAAAPLCMGFPCCGLGARGRWLCGGGAEAVASSSGLGRFAVLGSLFFASDVGAGVGPCVFDCGLALVPSLALFVGLHLDLGLSCEKKQLGCFCGVCVGLPVEVRDAHQVQCSRTFSEGF